MALAAQSFGSERGYEACKAQAFTGPMHSTA